MTERLPLSFPEPRTSARAETIPEPRASARANSQKPKKLTNRTHSLTREWSLVLLASLTFGACLGAEPHASVVLGEERDSLVAEFEKAIEEFDQGQQLLATQPDRARQLFGSAAQRFSGLLGAGVVNGYLEFNLANANLQAGDVGRAILHYKRAARMIPNDPMLIANLETAQARRLTQIQPRRGAAFFHYVFFWHYGTSLATRWWFGLWAYAILWGLLSLRNFTRSRGLKATTILCAVFALTNWSSAALSTWNDRHNPDGVVIGSDVSVFKGPGPGYQRQFEQPLQPGVEFTLGERRGHWWRITLSDGNSGWISSDAVDLVPTSAG